MNIIAGTVGEIRKWLEQYDDRQHIQVGMVAHDNPNCMYQMAIQKVIDSPGWHTDPDDKTQNIVRIVIHETNRILGDEI